MELDIEFPSKGDTTGCNFESGSDDSSEGSFDALQLAHRWAIQFVEFGGTG
jgi:hypothetical protein